MIYFTSDYCEGCHPAILERLAQTNFEQTSGYGTDPHCARAAEYIRRDCRAEGADVHFLVGGTQANLTVIAAALKPWQGAVAAQSGHIHVHETGAVEATGHKILTLPSLPRVFADGEIRGLHTKGNITVSSVGPGGKAEKVTLLSPFTQSVQVQVNGQMIEASLTADEVYTL